MQKVQIAPSAESNYPYANIWFNSDNVWVYENNWCAHLPKTDFTHIWDHTNMHLSSDTWLELTTCDFLQRWIKFNESRMFSTVVTPKADRTVTPPHTYSIKPCNLNEYPNLITSSRYVRFKIYVQGPSGTFIQLFSNRQSYSNITQLNSNSIETIEYSGELNADISIPWFIGLHINTYGITRDYTPVTVIWDYFHASNAPFTDSVITDSRVLPDGQMDMKATIMPTLIGSETNIRTLNLATNDGSITDRSISLTVRDGQTGIGIGKNWYVGYTNVLRPIT